ncbi:MAG: synthase, large subunit, partial [Thermomicrobiales bacterium]|nr:synthase, large subunit [Thermomicrobiales bacterium]
MARHRLGSTDGTVNSFRFRERPGGRDAKPRFRHRRVREAGVYSVLLPWDTSWDEIARLNPKGVILSGGPASVYEPGAPTLPAWVLREELPTLGICYGMYLLANALDGTVESAPRREYGSAAIS